MRGQSPRKPNPVLAGAGVAAVALAVVLGRRRLAGAATAARDRIASRRGPDQQTYRCDCGHTYGVSGTGRHRLYWPADADASAALMTPECVNCERPLPTH